MVDQPGQDDKKTTAQETIFNSDIGDDWGEAFEAEDFMASPQEEASSEFFLPDEPAEPTVKPGTTVVNVPPPAISSPGSITLLRQSLAIRFSKTPIPIRLALVVLPILGLILVLALHKSPRTVAPELSSLPPKAVAVHPPDKPAPQLQQPKITAHEAAPAQECKVPTPTPTPEQKKIRKKWRFPAIIVHTKTDNDQAPTILTADLTLVLRLTPEAIPPAEKDSFIREILYQFFTNQPLDDLQRYGLARGEMNRKLQAWITKQWPELPLDSIAIDRYQLL